MERLNPKARIAAVNVCRLLTAATFILSGFVKAVDPTGTQYKIRDYLEAWHMAQHVPDVLMLAASVALSAAEFVLGVCLLFAMHRRLASRLTLAVMAVLTPLTLWLALANPISDCGCFGDAVKLTNWQTFWKNVVLLACAAVLALRPADMMRFISRTNQWIVVNYSALFILAVSGVSLYYLPQFDFRPYRVGASIRQGMEIPPGAPDSTWTFVDSRTVQTEEGYVPPIHDFSIVRRSDGEDITRQVLADPGYTFLLIAPHLELADDSRFDLLNEIYEYSLEYGYPFYCLTASTDRAVGVWREMTGAEYPFCSTDATTLQTVIRSNPGLVLIKDGTVIRKWSHNDLPGDGQLDGPLGRISAGRMPERSVSARVAEIVGWFFIPLLLLTLADRLWAWTRYVRRGAKAPRTAPDRTKTQQNITSLKTEEHEKENRSRQLEDEHEPAGRSGSGKGAERDTES